MAAAVLPILTPAIIVGGIVVGLFTPTEASVVAVLYALLLGVFVYRTLDRQGARQTFYDSARFAAISLFCIGTASAFGWLLAYFHIPQLVVNAVATWGGGITSVGFITAAAFLVHRLLHRRDSRRSSSSARSSRRSPPRSACTRSISRSSA